MKAKLITIALGLLFTLGISNSSYSNNLIISEVTLTNDSTITFRVSWENSWRTNNAPYNHDAVWLFIKKRDCASLQWSHVNLSLSPANHSTTSPLEIYIDGRDNSTITKGVFVRRSSAGTGNVSGATVSLRMQGVTAGQYDFKVFGIEMVQIPAGSFSLGDGSSTGTFRAASTTNPFQVTSEGAITAGTAVGNLYSVLYSSSAFYPVSLPAAYPKGYKEIYCMKYEISQGQYVDFVNTLLADQGAARQITGTVNRLAIAGTWPALVANAPHRAMSHLNWYDLLAYLDWSALRPMTELEFEKIARGPSAPVAGEFSWGTNLITDANALAADGTATENSSTAITAGSGLANYGNTSVLGPIRCGFAAKPATNRLEAGAGYYGVMELSGNIVEAGVNSTDGTGAAFTGVLGDGEISLSPGAGFANVPGWPSAASGTAGGCLRGGSWIQGEATLRISDRTQAISLPSTRANSYGGRGVR
ncbi:Formylglycine-generating sulfatase enzyme [compost metagenome]